MKEIVVVPIYDTFKLMIADADSFLEPVLEGILPSVEITPPGFSSINVPLQARGYGVYDSFLLGISTDSQDIVPLPDGVYHFKFLTDSHFMIYTEKDYMRTDRLQEKFDSALLRLDITENDKTLKKQAKIDLMSIYFFIQGAIASANRCALIEADALYKQADMMLDNFNLSSDHCSSINYLI